MRKIACFYGCIMILLFFSCQKREYITIDKEHIENIIELNSIPERINIDTYLNNFVENPLSEDDVNTIKNELIGKNIEGISGQRIEYQGKTIGFFDMLTKQNFSIFSFDVIFDQNDNYQCKQLIIYSHFEQNIFYKEVWHDYDREKNTVWGLFKYSLNTYLKAEETYYPQNVIIINNATGEIELLSNEDKKYRMVNDQ